MIYIASPYSHSYPEVREWRLQQSMVYANWIMQQGFVCFAPLAYGVQFPAFSGDFETWREFDVTIIEACSAMHVLNLPGWDESHGVAEETKLALRIPITVAHIDWETHPAWSA